MSSTGEEPRYTQADFFKGTMWRVIKPGRLVGMKPCGPFAQQGWSEPALKGMELLCDGVQMTFGDGVPVVKWLTQDGKWIATDCEFLPKQGGMWFGVPHHEHLVPISAEIETLEICNFSINLRAVAETRIRGAFDDADAQALLQRVAKFPGRWVAWDPESDADGYLVCGDNPWDMAKEAVTHFELEVV